MRNLFMILIAISLMGTSLAAPSLAQATPVADGDILAGGLDIVYGVGTDVQEGMDPGTYPADQGPSALVDGGRLTAGDDGDVLTKHYVIDGLIDVTFDFGSLSGASIQVSGLELTTGDDCIERDPTGWELWGQVDSDSPPVFIASDASLTVPETRETDYGTIRFAATTEYALVRFVVTEVRGPGDSGCGSGSQLSTLKVFSPQAGRDFVDTETQLLGSQTCAAVRAVPESNGPNIALKMTAVSNFTISSIQLAMPLNLSDDGNLDSAEGTVNIYVDDSGYPAWHKPIAIYTREEVNSDLTPGMVTHYVGSSFAIAAGESFWVEIKDPTCNTNNPNIDESHVEYNSQVGSIEITRLNGGVEDSDVVTDTYTPAVALFGHTNQVATYNVVTGQLGDGTGQIENSLTGVEEGVDASVNFLADNGSEIEAITVDGSDLAADDFEAAKSLGEVTFDSISSSHSVFVTFSIQPKCYESLDGVLTNQGSCSGELVIGNEITSIGDNAFDQGFLESVTVPSSVQSIGEEAFAHNANLHTVNFEGSGLISIGRYSFGGNPQLHHIILPQGLLTIAPFAFNDSALQSIVLPTTLTEIGQRAFAYTELESIEIPENVTVIGKEPFPGYPTDAQINLHLSPMKIYSYEFLQCETRGPCDDGSNGPNLSYRILTRALPTGVVIDSETGVISGSPTEDGDFNPIFEVTYGDGATGTQGAFHFIVSGNGQSDPGPTSPNTDGVNVGYSSVVPDPRQDSRIDSATALLNDRGESESFTVIGAFPSPIVRVDVNGVTLERNNWVLESETLTVTYPIERGKKYSLQIWNGRAPLLGPVTIILLEPEKPIEIAQVVTPIVEQVLVAPVVKMKPVKRIITCMKGKSKKIVKAVKPRCPKGFKRKK
jgi:hypothetical protein